MIKPHYRKLCDWIHAHTPWKVFLHCCGSIYHLIPHFIEAGIDILNPVQTSAANMDPARLKREFGDRLVFWGGGCDTQRVLGQATPEEVREHVRERLRDLPPRRRLRVQPGPQHPGERAAGEHPRHVRRGVRVRRLTEHPKRSRPDGFDNAECTTSPPTAATTQHLAAQEPRLAQTAVRRRSDVERIAALREVPGVSNAATDTVTLRFRVVPLSNAYTPRPLHCLASLACQQYF